MCEVKNVIHVEGAALTTELIETIRDFQNNDNEMLDSYIKSVLEAICFIASNIFEAHEPQKCKEVLHDLTIIKDTMETFRKP